MKFNLIYSEGHSYHGGTNPYDQKEIIVVEKDGNVFEFSVACNYTYESFTAKAVELEKIQIPEKYDTRDRSYHRWCQHGGTVNLKLSKYKILDNNEFLLAAKAEEIRIAREESLAKQISADFMYSQEYISSLGLNKEEFSIAKAWREKIMVEAMNGVALYRYKTIFEKIVEICKEQAVVTCHKQSYYSRPGDYIISNSDVIDSNSYRGTLPLIEFDQYRPTSFEVYNISKEVEVAPDKCYLGSYNSQGYPVDVYKSLEEGLYCHSNIYTSWNNSQVWGKFLDRGLKVPRFYIEDGSEEPFAEDNLFIQEEKRVKREYFLNIMKAAQYAFGVSWAGAKSLLDEVGTVQRLATLVDVELLELSKKELEILSKKQSNLALDNFFNKRPDIRYPNAKLADITIAAEMLLKM